MPAFDRSLGRSRWQEMNVRPIAPGGMTVSPNIGTVRTVFRVWVYWLLGEPLHGQCQDPCATGNRPVPFVPLSIPLALFELLLFESSCCHDTRTAIFPILVHEPGNSVQFAQSKLSAPGDELKNLRRHRCRSTRTPGGPNLGFGWTFVTLPGSHLRSSRIGTVPVQGRLPSRRMA